MDTTTANMALMVEEVGIEVLIARVLSGTMVEVGKLDQ